MNESCSPEFDTEINPGIMVKWPLNRRSGAGGFGPSSATSMSLIFPKSEFVLPSQPVLLMCTQLVLAKCLLCAVTTSGPRTPKKTKSCQHVAQASPAALATIVSQPLPWNGL